MIASFKQLRSDIDISEREGFRTIFIASVIVAFATLYCVKELKIHPLIVTAIILWLSFFGRSLFRPFLGDFAKVLDVCGELSFGESSITWKSLDSLLHVDLGDIASINLRFNFVQGKQFAYKDIIHNGMAHLTLHTHAGQTYDIKFLIERSEQLKLLKPIWKQYYRYGIKIRESMGKYNKKTILFELSDLSYSKMQAQKKELNVDSFY